MYPFHVQATPGDDNRWYGLYARRMEVKTVGAFGYLRSHGIEPILIKGWAAARNYRGGNPRFYQDIDLAVSSDEFERATVLLCNGDGPSFDVDLHREVRHLDSKSWDSLLADSQLVELDGEAIRVPAEEDHLRILVVHWLTDGGERQERLWDIYHAVANRPPDFDWEKCFAEAGELRRDWVVVVIGLTHRYLGLKIDDLPFADEAADLPAWLTRSVEHEWRAGVRTKPLLSCLDSPSELWRQLGKRLPPNPIQATVDMEGDIRAERQFGYQLGSIGKRLIPSLGRVATRLRQSGK